MKAKFCLCGKYRGRYANISSGIAVFHIPHKGVSKYLYKLAHHIVLDGVKWLWSCKFTELA